MSDWLENMDCEIPVQEDLQVQYGYFGMFAHRESIADVNKWAHDLMKGFGEDEIRVMTLLQVLQNTHAILRAKSEIALRERIAELEESKSNKDRAFWIVAWQNDCDGDKYERFDSQNHARARYNELLKDPGLVTASVCMEIAGTDF